MLRVRPALVFHHLGGPPIIRLEAGNPFATVLLPNSTKQGSTKPHETMYRVAISLDFSNERSGTALDNTVIPGLQNRVSQVSSPAAPAKYIKHLTFVSEEAAT